MSINFDTSNETHQGPPDGTQGYLAACYRNIVDTKPSHFFEAESGIRSRVEWKTGKKSYGPNRKSNRLTKKKIPHTLCHIELLLGLIDVVQGLREATNLLARITVSWKFNLPYAISNQTSLLCANFVPTLISPTLYGLLYSVVMFLQQRTMDTGTNNPTDQDVDKKSPRRCCCCCCS